MHREFVLLLFVAVTLIVFPVNAAYANTTYAYDAGYVVGGQTFQFVDNAVVCAEIGYTEANDLVKEGYFGPISPPGNLWYDSDDTTWHNDLSTVNISAARPPGTV